VGESFNLPEEVTGFNLTNVTGCLYWQSGDRKLGEGFVGFGHLAPSTHLTEVRDGGDPLECSLWFPLSPTTVARIEELRRGQKVRFYADLRVSGYYAVTVKAFNPPAADSSDRGHPVAVEKLEKYVSNESATISFRINRLLMTTTHGGDRPLEVEKSQWVEEVLPGLGYGAWRTVELPLANLEEDLGKVDDLIHEAERQYYLGDWAASLTASRRAIEAIDPYAQRFVNPVHTQKVGSPAPEKMGDLAEAFEAWAKSAMGLSESARKLLHAGAHDIPANATLERADAELGLMFVIALRRYVGLRMLK